MEMLSFDVTKEDEGNRLDSWLANKIDNYSRTYIERLIKTARVHVNNSETKGNYKVKDGDRIIVQLTINKPQQILPENIPIDVLFEDNDILVVNKPRGMVVHPAAGNYSGTLVNSLLYNFNGSLSMINGETRPGIVHRIDKDTSGLLVIAKNDKAHISISDQMKNRSTLKEYLGIAVGSIKEESAKIEAPIARHHIKRKSMAVNVNRGKDAVTYFEVLERFKGYTYIKLRIETGRTHQIRVHMAHIGFPLLGDSLYGPRKQKLDIQGQCLHASTLGFAHPTTNKFMKFEAPLPQYFITILNELRQL